LRVRDVLPGDVRPVQRGDADGGDAAVLREMKMPTVPDAGSSNAETSPC
jgi:hypothetical protein